MRDRLLGPIMIAACALNFVALGLEVGVQALAYFRYDGDAQVLGYLFGAFGVGALFGAVAAQRLTRTADLLKLAAVAIVAAPSPFTCSLFRCPGRSPQWPSARSGSSRQLSTRPFSAC